MYIAELHTKWPMAEPQQNSTSAGHDGTFFFFFFFLAIKFLFFFLFFSDSCIYWLNYYLLLTKFDWHNRWCTWLYRGFFSSSLFIGWKEKKNLHPLSTRQLMDKKISTSKNVSSSVFWIQSNLDNTQLR